MNVLPLLWLAAADPTPSTLRTTDAAASGGPGWVVTVNLLIWTGIFIYLLRLDRRLAGAERRGDQEGERS